MKQLLLLIAFIFIAQKAWSATSMEKAISRHVGPMMVELEKKLSQDLMGETQFFIKDSSFKIQTTGTLDLKSLTVNLNIDQVNDDNMAEALGFDLVGSDELVRAQLRELQLNPQDLYPHLSAVNVLILSEGEMDALTKGELEGIINDRIEKLTNKKPIIEYKVVTTKVTTHAEGIPRMSPSTGGGFNWPSWLPFAFLAVGTMAMVGMFFIVLALRGQTRSIQESISQIQIQMPELTLNMPKDRGSVKAKESTGPQSIVLNQGDEEGLELTLSKIRQLLEKSDNLTKTFARLVVMEKRYPFALILREVLGAEKFILSIDPIFANDFTQYLRSEGSKILPYPDKMTPLAREVWGLLKSAQMDESLLFHHSLDNHVKNIRSTELISFLEEIPANEAALLLSFADPLEVAKAIHTRPELMENLRVLDQSKLTKELMSSLFSKVIKKQIPQKVKTGWDAIGSYLPFELEDRWYQLQGTPASDLLNQKERVFEFMDDLSMDDCASLLAALNPDLKKSYLSHLPEIKASRLKLREITLTDRSFELKHEMMTFLESIS